MNRHKKYIYIHVQVERERERKSKKEERSDRIFGGEIGGNGEKIDGYSNFFHLIFFLDFWGFSVTELPSLNSLSSTKTS